MKDVTNTRSDMFTETAALTLIMGLVHMAQRHHQPLPQLHHPHPTMVPTMATVAVEVPLLVCVVSVTSATPVS